MAKRGRPKRSKEIAIDCYLRHKQGQSEADIGRYYGWSILSNDHGDPICVTARKYIRDGKRYTEERIAIRNRAFDL